MKHGTTSLLVEVLALGALALAPGRALAQCDRCFLRYVTGPQFVVDHWKSDPILNMGTNLGVGWRFYNAMSEALHGYASVNAFVHNIPGATFLGKLYAEGTVSLLLSPRGVEQGWAPYFGGGGALVGAGPGVGGGSFLVLAGVRMPGHGHSPFFELQWFTRGSRISATVGILL